MMTESKKEEEGEKKVTVMILEVDLKCYCCYKKVKKLLSKFPQIRGQVFDEDKNKVMITVICCNPEKIRDELCCKGGKAIQTIEILEPKREKVEKKRAQEQSPPPPPPPPPRDDNREKLENKPSEKTNRPSVSAYCQECYYEGRGGGPCHYGYGRPVPPPPGQCVDTFGYPYTGNRPSCVTRCDDYFSEENPQGCSII